MPCHCFKPSPGFHLTQKKAKAISRAHKPFCEPLSQPSTLSLWAPLPLTLSPVHASQAWTAGLCVSLNLITKLLSWNLFISCLGYSSPSPLDYTSPGIPRPYFLHVLAKMSPHWWEFPWLPTLSFIATQSPVPALFLTFVKKIIIAWILVCIYVFIVSFSLFSFFSFSYFFNLHPN